MFPALVGQFGPLVSITVVAVFMPVCTPPVRTLPATAATRAESLWVAPTDLAERDLFYGSWGAENAPSADATYQLVGVKHHGVNPGLTVRDPQGRKWSLKQPLENGLAPEGPVEVTLSRVLDAVGYHQPPVYYLPSLTIADDWGTHRVQGGRLRLSHPRLKEIDTWSWQQNPFVGTRPYQGLLAILLLFNSSDLKNSNNSLYVWRDGDRAELRFVVRDLGTGLGSTGRFAPTKNDAEVYEHSRFILGVRRGFVDFDYHGWHQELVRQRLTPADVGWAAHLLAGLTPQQWQDAFRAGGYTDADAARFIRKIHLNIAEAMQVADTATVRVAGLERR